MASSTELSDRVAEALGVPGPSVALTMRMIREAGLITQGGRGRSAARMTPADAASLIISVTGSSRVRDSVASLQAFAGLEAQGWRSGGWPVHSLRRNHSFREALVALIDGVATGELRHVQEFALRIELSGPEPRA